MIPGQAGEEAMMAICAICRGASNSAICDGCMERARTTGTVVDDQAQPAGIEAPASADPLRWEAMEARLLGRMAELLGALHGDQPAGSPLGANESTEAVLKLLLNVETAALDAARIELRADGMIPSTPTGQRYWFDVAASVSAYLRRRLGMGEHPPGWKS